MNTELTITREFHTTRRRDGQQRLRPGRAPETPQGKIPRISRLMALAIHCDELLRTGQVANQSALAEYAQITPARLTQILTLLNLAPEIQEEILFLPRTTKGRGEIQEKDVRRIAMNLDWSRQRETLLRQQAGSGNPLLRPTSLQPVGVQVLFSQAAFKSHPSYPQGDRVNADPVGNFFRVQAIEP